MKHVLTVYILLFLSFLSASAETVSGQCGELQYSIDLDKSELRLSGNGYASDYEQYSAPWYSLRHKINTVIVEEGVKSIPAHGFEVMSRLNTVMLPSTIERIGDYAFWACIRLENINTENMSNAVIGDHAFSSCKQLSNINLKGFKDIAPYCFEDCKKLRIANIGDSCSEIGRLAFYGCDSLRRVSFSDNLTEIGDSAFFNCAVLDSVVFPNKLRKIGDAAFENCYALGNVTLHENVEDIGYRAFEFCESMTYVDLESTKLDTIKTLLFDGCKSLKEVKFPKNLKFIGFGGFRNCSSLERIEIPKDTKYLSEQCFLQCDNLKTIILPDSLETIGVNCFNTCRSIEEFTIPVGIKRLGTSFLGITPNLKRLYMLSPELFEDVRHFDISDILPQRVTLYVKKGNKKKVKNTYWRHFTMVEEIK